MLALVGGLKAHWVARSSGTISCLDAVLKPGGWAFRKVRSSCHHSFNHLVIHSPEVSQELPPFTTCGWEQRLYLRR